MVEHTMYVSKQSVIELIRRYKLALEADKF